MAVNDHTHQSFTTTTCGLRRDILPMILFDRAKKIGIWNPADIDYSQDTEDWNNFSPDQQSYVKLLLSRFISGEEAVTLDLLPLMKVISEQGHLEEAMYLTTFLWEEAKHIDMFAHAMDAYGVAAADLEEYHSGTYRGLFYDTLPTVMNALYSDPSPQNLVRASATYNLGIEGVLAETGYFTWYQIMDRHQVLPGTRKGVRNIQLDESRHIAYGVFLISRLVAEDPSLFEIVEEVMDDIMKYTAASAAENKELFPEIPFDFDYDLTQAFSRDQYSKRLNRIKNSMGKTLEEIYTSGRTMLDEDEAKAG